MVTAIDVKLTTTAPLSHGAFGDGTDTGNAMMFRREPIVSLQGFPRVPVVSGNAIRGVTRRSLMRELYLRSGVTIDSFIEHFGSEVIGRRAWDRLYGAIACGGTLEEAEVRIIPDEIRKLRKDFPALSILGSAMYSSMLPGMCSFGFAWPVCAETVDAGLCIATSDDIPTSSDLISDVGLVRHVDRENVGDALTPMPVTVECLATGTQLQFQVNFEPQATEIEIHCIVHGLKALKALGGKHGAGFGSVDVELSYRDDSLYLDWLEKTDIRRLLHNLAEKLS